MHMIMKCDRMFLNNAIVNILWCYVAQEKIATVKKCLFNFSMLLTRIVFICFRLVWINHDMIKRCISPQWTLSMKKYIDKVIKSQLIMVKWMHNNFYSNTMPSGRFLSHAQDTHKSSILYAFELISYTISYYLNVI